MKEIIMKKENAEKINALIAEVQGRATVRTTNYEDIVNVVNSVMSRIGDIPKKAIEGTVIEYDQRQTFPKAYKYKPESTSVYLIYRNGNWRITNICRETCPNRNGYSYGLHLSETAKAAVLKLYE